MPLKFPTVQVNELWEQVTLMVRVWWMPLLFVWTFLFAGVVTLGIGFASTLEAWHSRSWPTVEGLVTLSQVDSYLSESDSGTTQMYHAQVNFTYTVGGRTYFSDLVNLGDYSTSVQANAEKVAARYPAGATVQVYYDPGKPETAVLEPGPTAGLLIPLFVGAVVSLVGGLMTYFLLRKILGKEGKHRRN